MNLTADITDTWFSSVETMHYLYKLYFLYSENVSEQRQFIFWLHHNLLSAEIQNKKGQDDLIMTILYRKAISPKTVTIMNHVDFSVNLLVVITINCCFNRLWQLKRLSYAVSEEKINSKLKLIWPYKSEIYRC